MTLIAITALLLLGIVVALTLRALLLPRLQAAERVGDVQVYGYVSTASDTVETTSEDGRTLQNLAASVGTALARRYPERFNEDEIRSRLTAAGIYTFPPLAFVGARGIAAAVMPGLVLFSGSAFGAGFPILVLGSVVGALLGWRLPDIAVERRGKTRVAQIDRDMAELVDLLIVTIEAGVGFSGALQHAAGRVTGPLGDELRLTTQEHRMGLSTAESLSNMMARIDSPSMRSFVRSILQGEQLGVSIGQIMRNLAAEMRKRRRAAAEERAHKAPIKMLFPLVFLIFPSLFIVLLYPALVQIGESL
jgi:tight adherence protein C